MANFIHKLKNRLRKQSCQIVSHGRSGLGLTKEEQNGLVMNEDNGHKGKLVVVGRESEFPRDLVEYALDMAERMSYEIVALNTAPLSCETFKFFSSSRSKLCRDFQNLSEESAASFQNEVNERGQGIVFTHVIKFCEIDQALKDLQDEIGDIDFVVSDTQYDAIQEPQQDGKQLQSEIVVYAMVQ